MDHKHHLRLVKKMIQIELNAVIAINLCQFYLKNNNKPICCLVGSSKHRDDGTKKLSCIPAQISCTRQGNGLYFDSFRSRAVYFLFLKINIDNVFLHTNCVI